MKLLLGFVIGLAVVIALTLFARRVSGRRKEKSGTSAAQESNDDAGHATNLPTTDHRGDDSPICVVLQKNRGQYAWLYGRVLRLRTKADCKIGDVDHDSVTLVRARDGTMTRRIPYSELLAVALPASMTGADLGHPIEPQDAHYDTVLVTDRPFKDTLRLITEEESYLWRSSVAFDMFNRISVLVLELSMRDGDQQTERAHASEMLKLGRQVLELEPDLEEATFFWSLGLASFSLKDCDGTITAQDRALELDAERGGLNDLARIGAVRDLALCLAMRGEQRHDADDLSRALQLLDTLDLEPEDSASKIRDFLRESGAGQSRERN